MANGDGRYAWNGGKLSEATKTKLLTHISASPPKMKAVTVCSSSSSATEYLRRNILQEPSDPSEHLAEEEVARLSGELEWLREETRHGDRKLEELQDQVISSNQREMSET